MPTIHSKKAFNVIGTKLGHRSASPAYELSMSAWDVVIEAADRQPAWNQMG